MTPKEKIIKDIALDIAFMEVSVDVSKIDIAFDSIVDRVKDYLQIEKQPPEEWVKNTKYSKELEPEEIEILVNILNQYATQPSEKPTPEQWLKEKGIDDVRVHTEFKDLDTTNVSLKLIMLSDLLNQYAKI
jgi:hypothetical protein